MLKLKTYCWNHCSKIIFKCVNSTVGPIFNEKVAKKWNLWVHKQYMITVCYRKVNIYGYCLLNSTWTVTTFCQNAWKKKKKRTKTQNADGFKTQTCIQTSTKCSAHWSSFWTLTLKRWVPANLIFLNFLSFFFSIFWTSFFFFPK